MKKAEQRALEAYPVRMVRRRYDGVPSNDDPYDSNLHDRYCFQRGYEQAEKDINKEMMDRMAEIHEKMAKNAFKDIDYGIAIQAIQSKEDLIAIIQSRIDEILGDAQPKPALRAELQELITRIKENEQ